MKLIHGGAKWHTDNKKMKHFQWSFRRGNKKLFMVGGGGPGVEERAWEDLNQREIIRKSPNKINLME